MTSLKEKAFTKSIDLKGLICPYPIIETRKELKQLKKGDILEVITDNPPTALETLPQLCQTRNYPFERIEENGAWRFLLQKTD